VRVIGRTEALESANLEIQNLLQTKNRFVNQVAHDLRTPLTPIKILLPSLAS
jgi:signal transduction histidine kinase